jgi:RNA polymerase sigma factor (TIGR02999 family)
MSNEPSPVEDSSTADVTRLLNDAAAGKSAATKELFQAVYDQLRLIARQRMANERPDHTLQATALVHEAYVRLVGDQDVHWNSRSHFFAAAAEAMRRILVEQARRKSSIRHGGGRQRVKLQDTPITVHDDAIDIVGLSEALDRLHREDPRKAELVKLRFFTGMTISEAAEAMGISHATADRYWAYSRLRLYQWMRKQEPPR